MEIGKSLILARLLGPVTGLSKISQPKFKPQIIVFIEFIASRPAGLMVYLVNITSINIKNYQGNLNG